MVPNTDDTRSSAPGRSTRPEYRLATESSRDEAAIATRESLLVEPSSDEPPTLSVVIPTLNEERGIEQCIAAVKSAVAEIGVRTELIVSDSSSDRTPEIAHRLGARVVKPDERGYGNAYKHAFRHVRGQYIAMGDADTTYDFTELPSLVERASDDGVDLVIGSRLNGEIKAGAMPLLHRYIGNPLLTRFLNAFYDAGVSDAHSGMRVLRRETLETLELSASGMEFASEMIMDAAAKGLTIEEVPITYHPREGEATLESFRDGWRHVRFMLVNAPGYLYSPAAVGTLLVGLTTMVLSLTGATLGGIPFGLQTMIGGTLLTLVGYQVACLALFSSIATDPIRKPRDPITRYISRHFRLEHGASIGLTSLLVGVLYLTAAVSSWYVHDYARFPPATWSLLALTAIVLGVQTLFSSFFLDMLMTKKG